MEHNLTDTEITEIPETDEPTPENDSLFTGDDLMKIVLTAALVWIVKEGLTATKKHVAPAVARRLQERKIRKAQANPQEGRLTGVQ